MKVKHLFLAIMAMLIAYASGFTLTAFASGAIDEPVSYGSVIEAGRNNPDRHELTDQQKADMQAKQEAFKKKWDSLSSSQKAEIINARDKVFDSQIEVIDKYLKYGLIDNEYATFMKNRINDHKAEMQNKVKMPGFWQNKK